MPHIDELDVHILENQLRRRGLNHLRVHRHGRKLYIESTVGLDTVKHARLTIKTSQTWTLGFPDHRGRMSETPYSGTLQELVALTADQFPWMFEERT